MGLFDNLFNTSRDPLQSMSSWGAVNNVIPGLNLDDQLFTGGRFGFNSLGRYDLNKRSGGLWGIEGLTPVNALGLGFQALSGLSGLIGGRKQLSLQRDALNFQKDAFNKNYENQRKLTNAQLEDRQRSRIASNPGAYMSVDEYMKKYGV